METKTNFTLGQKVWAVKVYLFGNRNVANISYGIISKMSLKDNKIVYQIGDGSYEYHDENLFLTKENAQQELEKFWEKEID